jgi:hypothetical protein
MTPIPLILPLRASEAGALADLVYQQVEGKGLTEDVRHRFAARVPPLGLQTFTPFPGSWQQDPIHLSTYYIAIDTRGEPPQSLLLRIALDSSPASGLFPGAVLIGRMRTGGGREVVINAIPFAAGDHSNINTFAEQVDRAFLPRPQGPYPAISVRGGNPEATFRDFGGILKAAGTNLASLECPYHAGVWAAIRAGWREGFNLGAGPIAAAGATDDEILRAAAAGYTRFTIEASMIEASGHELTRVEELHDHIAKIKAGQNSWKHFDFELSLRDSHPNSIEELRFCLKWLKTRGRPPQLIEPNLNADRGCLAELAEVARQFNATLSIRSRGNERERELEEIARATGGRFNYKVSGKDADLRRVASCLLGQSIPA